MTFIDIQPRIALGWSVEPLCTLPPHGGIIFVEQTLNAEAGFTHLRVVVAEEINGVVVVDFLTGGG